MSVLEENYAKMSMDQLRPGSELGFTLYPVIISLKTGECCFGYSTRSPVSREETALLFWTTAEIDVDVPVERTLASLATQGPGTRGVTPLVPAGSFIGVEYIAGVSAWAERAWLLAAEKARCEIKTSF